MRLFFSVAALLLVFATAAHAQDPLRVIYGFDREFPPFTFEMDGDPAGFDIDILKAVLHGQNVSIKFTPMTWERALLELSSGNVLITSGMARTRQRLLLYTFSDLPLLPVQVRLFTKDFNRVPNITLLRGKRVSVQKGSLYKRVLEEFGGFNIKTFPTELDALKALWNDKVEVYCGPDRSAYYYIEKLKMGRISGVGTPLHVTDVYFAMHREQKELHSMINAGMRRIRENGEYDRIFRKWFVKEMTTDERNELIKAAADTRINAYAPYSRNTMGAAVMTNSGNIFTGANVENAQPTLNMSALKIALAKAVSEGETEIRAAVAVRPDGMLEPPTAEERQMLFEFGRGVLVMTEPWKGEYRVDMVSQMLPQPYRPQGGQPKF